MSKSKRVFSVPVCMVVLSAVCGLLLLAPGVSHGKKAVELSFALVIPPNSSPFYGAFEPWSKEIEKRTDGRVKFTFYMSQSLVKARNSYDAVVNGICDITWGGHALTPGRFPLMSVMELSFMSPNTFVGAHALTDLYAKFPEMKAEHADVHLLGLWVTLPYEIHTVKKPIRKLEDMRGMKLATPAGAAAALNGLGAVPVVMASPQLYQTVEKGVADGAVIAWGAYNTWKLEEVTKYHTNAHLGGNCFWMAVNNGTWKSLTPEIRKIITEVTEEMMPGALCSAVSGEMEVGIKKTRELGHEIIDLPPEEMGRWRATAEPEWKKWVADMESKGLPGKAVFDEAHRLVEHYSAKYMK